jgi:hypothetical protein
VIAAPAKFDYQLCAELCSLSTPYLMYTGVVPAWRNAPHTVGQDAAARHATCVLCWLNCCKRLAMCSCCEHVAAASQVCMLSSNTSDRMQRAPTPVTACNDSTDHVDNLSMVDAYGTLKAFAVTTNTYVGSGGHAAGELRCCPSTEQLALIPATHHAIVWILFCPCRAR